MENPKIIQRQILQSKKHPDHNVMLFQLKSGQLTEVHFTIRGPKDTIFEGGLYHGTIIIPKQYPYYPPNVQMLMPSGRFEINQNICFSFTAFHPETWSVAVNFNALCIALQSLFDAWDERSVGMISHCNKHEIERCRRESLYFECKKCGCKHANIINYFSYDQNCDQTDKQKTNQNLQQQFVQTQRHQNNQGKSNTQS